MFFIYLKDSFLAVDYPADYVEKFIYAVSSSRPNERSNKMICKWMKVVSQSRYGNLKIDTMERTYTNRYL